MSNNEHIIESGKCIRDSIDGGASHQLEHRFIKYIRFALDEGVYGNVQSQ